MSWRAKDKFGVVHDVAVKPTKLALGLLRCQVTFSWKEAGSVRFDRMEPTDDRTGCIGCLGHWTAT